MSTVLFNPTNEDMKAQYIGEVTFIKAGEKKKVDDKRARHILNNLGPRGLMTLDYGDEGEQEKKKAELGRRRNHDFKKTQVLRFNMQNDQRSERKLPYQAPDDFMKSYAEEVGIPLIQPYRPSSEESDRMAALTQEREDLAAEVKEKDKDITELKGEIGDLKKTMTDFMKMIKPDSETPDKTETEEKEEVKEEPEDLYPVIKQQYAGLSKTKFQDWVLRNENIIPTYPEKNQKEIAAMWKKFFKEDYPYALSLSEKKG